MSRQHDDSNLYRVGGTYYLKIEIDKKQIRRSLRTKNRAEAQTRRDECLSELLGNTHPWRDAVTLWLAEYLPQNVGAATAQRYEVSLGQIASAMVTHRGARVMLEAMPIEAITLKTVREVVAWSKRNRPSITHATLCRDLTALSSVLHACVGWGWREDNPARNYDRSHIKERRDPITLPTDDHVDAVLAHAPAPWAEAVRFLDATGMRADEGFGLTHEAIATDLSGAILTKTKSGRARFVPFSQRAAGIVAGIPRHLRSPFVFWHGSGARYANVSARHITLRSKSAVTEMAGGEVTFSLHHLRHRFAVRYLHEGGNIYDLQAILGHGSLKTTEIYLDFLDPETRQRAMRRVTYPAHKPA